MKIDIYKTVVLFLLPAVLAGCSGERAVSYTHLPWGRLQRSVSCVNVVPSEYGTSVPKGMTCLSWGTGGFSFIPLEPAPGGIQVPVLYGEL